MKKGQVTVFLIIGALILIGAFLLFYLRQEKTEFRIPADANSVNTFVTKCLEDTASKSIQVVGIQGGFIQISPLALETNYSTISYHYYNRNYTAPSKQTIESQLSLFVEQATASCVGNFSSFKGYNITSGKPEVVAMIRENDVLFKINYSITIEKDDSKTELKEFLVTSPVRLGHVYDISQLIIAKIMEDPEWIDMTFLSSFDVKVDILPYDDKSIVYSISDKESSVDGAPYSFIFAGYYIANKALVLDIPSELRFKDGEAVIYKVNATDPEGDRLTFSDDTAMFDITENGVILFTPEIPGIYDVVIGVEDGHNNKVSKSLRVIIEE